MSTACESIEVEAKARLANREKTEALLLQRGAVFQGEVHHHDTYFHHPQRDYWKTDEALRLRKITRDGKIEYRLTYKGPKMDQLTKTRKEVEIVVDDLDAANLLLQNLKFTPLDPIEKQRRFYKMDQLYITVDYIEGLGWFMEAETIVKDNWEEARDGVLAFMDSMGCSDLERTSYLELVLEMREKIASAQVLDV